jgi:hypothetical protein
VPRIPGEGPPAWTALLDCPECGCLVEGFWAVDVIDIEQVDAPPVGVQQCVDCGHRWEVEAPIWHMFGEAG